MSHRYDMIEMNDICLATCGLVILVSGRHYIGSVATQEVHLYLSGAG